MTERLETDEFAARVAAPLKAAVTLSAGFDARLQRALEEAAQPWWRRRRTLVLSPLGSMALAAGFAGLITLAGLGAIRTFAGPEAAVAQAAPDTVHVVRFIFADPTAQSVALVGDFNGWSRDATPLVATDGSGHWVASVTLTPGRHEYAFVIDGERWVVDPFALSRRDEFGQENSVVRVGGESVRGA